MTLIWSRTSCERDTPKVNNAIQHAFGICSAYADISSEKSDVALAWDNLATPLQFPDVVSHGASDKVILGVSPSGDGAQQPKEDGDCLKRETHREKSIFEIGSVEER